MGGWLGGNHRGGRRIIQAMITHFHHRRPRAHLFAFSVGHVALACALVIGAVTALGLLTGRAHSAPPTAPPGFAWAR